MLLPLLLLLLLLTISAPVVVDSFIIPNANVWSSGKGIDAGPGRQYGHVAFTDGANLFVFGGSAPSPVNNNTIWRLNPVHGTWTLLTNLSNQVWPEPKKFAAGEQVVCV